MLTEARMEQISPWQQKQLGMEAELMHIPEIQEALQKVSGSDSFLAEDYRLARAVRLVLTDEFHERYPELNITEEQWIKHVNLLPEQLLSFWHNAHDAQNIHLLMPLSTEKLVDDTEGMVSRFGFADEDDVEDREHDVFQRENWKITARETLWLNLFLKNLSEKKREPVLAILNARSGSIYEHGLDRWSDQITDPEERAAFAHAIRSQSTWKTNKSLALYMAAKDWMEQGKLPSFFFSTKNFKFASYQETERLTERIPENIKEFALAKANLVVIDPSKETYPGSFFNFTHMVYAERNYTHPKLDPEIDLINKDIEIKDETDGGDRTIRQFYYKQQPEVQFHPYIEWMKIIGNVTNKAKHTLYDRLQDFGYPASDIKGLALSELLSEKSRDEFEYYSNFFDEKNDETIYDAARVSERAKKAKVILLNPYDGSPYAQPWFDNFPQTLSPEIQKLFAHHNEESLVEPYQVMTNRGPMELSDFIRKKLRELSGAAAKHADARETIAMQRSKDELAQLEAEV